MTDAAAIADRLAAVRSRIAGSCGAALRDLESVTLVAVSKTQPAEAVAAALAAGQRVFGENRVQEALAKYPALRQRHPDLRLHLIGPLQTNKVKEAVALCDVIETLDRPRLAEALTREMARQNRTLDCFIEVNIGNEPQKAGVKPEGVEAFIAECRTRWKLSIIGLMCIPPEGRDAVPYFNRLAKLAARSGLKGLSMGMSADFEAAIGCGATHVRVGTAIFGACR
ncbi:MAG TPA: YggS family pyridoxal phosphate-dependent enzyme [Stellaceae bacterium]